MKIEKIKKKRIGKIEFLALGHVYFTLLWVEVADVDISQPLQSVWLIEVHFEVHDLTPPNPSNFSVQLSSKKCEVRFSIFFSLLAEVSLHSCEVTWSCYGQPCPHFYSPSFLIFLYLVAHLLSC